MNIARALYSHAIQSASANGYSARSKGEDAMVGDPDQDKVEKFEVSGGKTPGTYELYLKTKSEEFDFIVDGENLQKLGDAIYEAIDKNEGKQ
jgi:hypothetical protein